jgi:hypothetical protein
LWFWRKKKATRTQNELNPIVVASEMEGKSAAKELGSNQPKKQLYAGAPMGELHSEAPPPELAGDIYWNPPVEME